jgi:uncharacterized protein YndB with AHSA1/START domain
MSKKQLFTLEFPVRCSPNILFEFLSTASGLQEWFADKVDEWENVFSFSWNGGVPDKAELLDQEADKFIRFKWLHSEKNEYFEFSIEKTEISNQTILIIRILLKKMKLKTKANFGNIKLKSYFIALVVAS